MGQRRVVQLCLLLVLLCNAGSRAGFNEYSNCTAYEYLDPIGNSACDWENNIEACGLYGGDCYECTCGVGSCFPQLENGFDFGDTEATTERYVSMELPTSITPCPPERQHDWLVGNTSQARALAEALNCSGGIFMVEWRGSVVIDQTLSVVGGTVLSVTGVGSGALMDGGGSTGLFTVINSSLYLNNMGLFNASSVSGGAIAAFGSNIFLSQTKFAGNIATLHGGAMFVAGGSTVTCSGENGFFNNFAPCRGGAVCVWDRSHATWTNGATFSNNSASFGGAVDISFSSSASWAGFDRTTFSNNTARLGGGLTVGVNSSATWETGSTFEGNMAYSGGGVFVSGGSALWMGPTSFSGNVADGYGGALYAENQSTLYWVSKATFSSNSAFAGGGAVYITAFSIASWTAVTSFYNNTASIGGGIYLTRASVGSWFDNTTLVQNGATGRSDGGGAVRLEGSSTFWWKGKTIFSGNIAYGYGGALLASGNSSASWEGQSVFVGNNASILGGALFVTNGSIVSWNTDTSFVSNSGQYGGALCVANSSVVSWRGSTLFHNNTADSGGAVVAAANSRVELIGDTNFTANQAQMDGGAISSAYSSSLPSYTFDEEPSIFVVGGRANFAYNKCGWSGGAMAVSDLLSLETTSSAVITFLGNTAGVLGGAIFISSLETVFVFRGVVFDSNSAQAGGGVFAFASGTARSSDSITSDSVENFSIFDTCSFENNVAYTTGGAIHSAYRLDVIVNSIFVGNVAFAGGALLLSGTAYLENCSFVDNVASAGPAVFNFGYVTGLISIAFHDNGPSCDNGSFINFREGQQVELHQIVCYGCPYECDGCNYGEKVLLPECTALSVAGIEHASSAGGVIKLEDLDIDQGYWRASASSTDILECYNGDACRGGITGRADYCSKGYKGAYCSVCRTNYTHGLNFVCTPCTARKWGVVIACVGGVVSLAVGLSVILYLVAGDTRGSGRGLVERIAYFFPLQSLKIIIVVWQIVTQFTSVANVTFPDVYQSFLDAVDLLNFDLSWLFSTGCVFSFDFHDRLLIATIGPLVCITLLGITYAGAMVRHRSCETAMQNVQQKHMSMVLLLTFLVYSRVSSMVFQMFACEVLDDDKNYLRADYRIECDSPKHKTLQIYAGVMILLYPLGIPLLFATLLFRNRNALRKALDRGVTSEVQSISDLWKPYKPSRFYFEVIECIRRILLTGVVVFIYPNTLPQIAVTLVMSFVFTTLSEALAPYDKQWDTWISRTGHVIVFMSVFTALLLKVDISSERAGSQKLLATILVAAHICMVLAVVIETVVIAFSVTTEEGDSTRTGAGCPQFGWPIWRPKLRGVCFFPGVEKSVCSAERGENSQACRESAGDVKCGDESQDLPRHMLEAGN